MPRRQRSTPHLVEGTTSRPLQQIPSTDKSITETWLQRLLFEHPSLLPVSDLEPAFGSATALARELPTRAGPVDLLLVNGLGYLTLVETKLFRNPEARREVVAQILDYAKELSRWTYADLCDAVRRAGGFSDVDPIFAAVSHGEGDVVDPDQFRRAVGQGLRHGRFLLVVVGDEISDHVEGLVDYLQNHAHLQFTLGLVSLSLYRIDKPPNTPILIVPRVIARTTEIVRAIVRIEGADSSKVTVASAPAEDTRTSPSLESFWEAISNAPDAGSRQALEELFREMEKLNIYVDPLETGLALRLPDPTGTDAEFRLLRITKRGRVRSFVRLKAQLERAGYDGRIAVRHVEAIAKWISGAKVDPNTGNMTRGQVPDYEFPVKVLSQDHRDQYLHLVADLLNELRTVAASKGMAS